MNSLVAVDVGNSSIKLGWFPDGCTSGELPPSQVLTLSEEELAVTIGSGNPIESDSTTAITCSSANYTLIDGEYITNDRFNNDIKTYIW